MINPEAVKLYKAFREIENGQIVNFRQLYQKYRISIELFLNNVRHSCNSDLYMFTSQDLKQIDSNVGSYSLTYQDVQDVKTRRLNGETRSKIARIYGVRYTTLKYYT